MKTYPSCGHPVLMHDWLAIRTVEHKETAYCTCELAKMARWFLMAVVYWKEAKRGE